MHPKEREIKCKKSVLLQSSKTTLRTDTGLPDKETRQYSLGWRSRNYLLDLRSGRHPPLPCLVRASPFALFVDDDLVVHAEFTLGHSAQVAFHHYPARHVGAQDLACTGGKERGDRLQI